MDYLTSLANLLALVPESILVGVLTAAVALIVVVIQNRSHRKNLVIQLSNDAGEKERDRKISYRKDVYLNYVAQATKAFSYIGVLPYRNIATENPVLEVSGFAAAIAQTCLIVDDDSCLLLIDLNKQLTIFMVGAAHKMKPISDLTMLIALEDNRFQHSIAEQKRVSDEQVTMIEAGVVDDVRRGNLQRTFEWHSEQILETLAKRGELQKSLATLQYQFSKYILEHLIPLGELNLAVNSRLRIELGIATDILKIKASMNQARDSVIEEVKRQLDELHNEQLQN